ncbi:hypothetical protein BG015_002121 [Linnemannia schmuckeri]|uniref:F-box domain-containing protein n=1 Tax=Linnemannia schmuckeri TaxID=64567 RepID=A0A9P5RSE3_9FUNG|nr:hypothetical protein BG015_002121 [Linnemannia schmuckeri]
MPPHPNPSVMERVLNLPELISAIGFNLPQEDLYACTLVNHHWHDILIPILWHTIDDKTGSWSDILRYYDDYTCHYGFDKQWLHGIFRKYGHHIHHLRAKWAAIVIAANESGVCTNLLSLKTNGVDRTMTDRQVKRNAQGPPPHIISCLNGISPMDSLILGFGSSQPAAYQPPSSFAFGTPLSSAFGILRPTFGSTFSSFGSSQTISSNFPSSPSSFSYQGFGSSAPPPSSSPPHPPAFGSTGFVFGDPAYYHVFSVPSFASSTSFSPSTSSSSSSSSSQPTAAPPGPYFITPLPISVSASAQAAVASRPTTATTTQSAFTYCTPLTSTPHMVSPPLSHFAPQSAREAAKRRRGAKQDIDFYVGIDLFRKQLLVHPQNPHSSYKLISPALAGVFSMPTYPYFARTSAIGFVAPSKQEQDWEVQQHIWLLVRDNLHTLRGLELDGGVEVKFPICKQDFFYETLGQAQYLRELEVPYDWVSIPRLLDTIPSL